MAASTRPRAARAPALTPAPAIRVSDQDRDAVAQRLQEAFAEGGSMTTSSTSGCARR